QHFPRFEITSSSFPFLTSNAVACISIGLTCLLNDETHFSSGGQKAGGEKDANQGDVDVYDPVSDTWQALAPIFPPRGHIMSSTLGTTLNFKMNRNFITVYSDNHFLVAGGAENGGFEGLPLASVVLYDIGANKWFNLTDLPGGRKSPVAGIIGDQVHQ